MEHECTKEEFLGKVSEFMENSKGFKTTLFTIALAILIQVGTFLYLWGSLVTTVKVHDKEIVKQEAKIDRILDKLGSVKFVYAQGDKGDKGDRGERGQQGETGSQGIQGYSR